MNDDTMFSVIITDLNHNIRDLLYRELVKARFDASCISTGPEAYSRIMQPGGTDAVILDPEMLSPYGCHLLDNVLRQDSGPMIILHTYHFIDDGPPSTNPNLIYIEKDEDSIDTILEKMRQWRTGKAARQ